ncbi:MAG: NAD(P)-dependent oxidoreductase [Comamonadaceae bacterium]|nr:MAG: NAD(P)-dependent oxidoreductase [Comamonadaceae bacterium]
MTNDDRLFRHRDAQPVLGFIGCGEVGSIFGAGLCGREAQRAGWTWDRKFADPDAAPGEAPRARDRATAAGLGVCESMADLCARADLLISAVTASNTLAVALEAAASLRPGTVFLDLNSASPAAKQAAAAEIEAAGGRYVEAGVMTSVPPYGIRVPMLLGGPAAGRLQDTLNAWGMDTRAVAESIGTASAIKMCRSVMIKGLEALVIESYATARAYGVEDQVLPTLAETFPSIDWSRQGAYFFSRVVQHGRRRAEEMREAAATVREAGFEPWMSEAIARKQQWMADQARAGRFEGLGKDAPWQAYADRLLAARGTSDGLDSSREPAPDAG